MVEEKVQTFFPLSNYKTSCLKECQKHDGQVKILEVTGEDPTCTFVTLPLQSFAFQMFKLKMQSVARLYVSRTVQQYNTNYI